MRTNQVPDSRNERSGFFLSDRANLMGKLVAEPEQFFQRVIAAIVGGERVLAGGKYVNDLT